VDSAKTGPLFHSNYDSEKLALLFRLIARHAKYSSIIHELYSASESTVTADQMLTLTLLFFDCCRHFVMETFACLNPSKITPQKIAENNRISYYKAFTVPVITPNYENLSFNFGLILHLRKEQAKLIQNIYLKVKDPKQMQGLSLYYNFSVPDNDQETRPGLRFDLRSKFGLPNRTQDRGCFGLSKPNRYRG
jgi:hypothetical protein